MVIARMHGVYSDHPTLNDQLERLDSVKNKAAQIMSCDTPQVFGIHGDWGSGKTSYLRQLRYHLDGIVDGADVSTEEMNQPLEGDSYKNQVVTVWFDAWRYQHESAPIIALLQEIRKQFGTWAKIKNKSDKLANVSINAVLNGLSDLSKLLTFENSSLTPTSIREAGEHWEKEHLENRLGTDNVQAFLEKATEAVLSSFLGEAENKRLVVFIDDLDRCSPTSAYRLLEGLKVYMSIKNCVFIIGMNQQIVVEAIASNLPGEMSQYGGENQMAAMCIRGEAYLEKICSHIERLKPPKNSDDFLFSLIYNSHLKIELVNSSVLILQPFLPPNPRRLKALANVLNEWGELIDWETSPDKERKAQALLIVAYVYQFHGELFQRWNFTPAFYSQLKSWAAESWESTDGTKWPPYLATLKLPHLIVSDDGQHEVPQYTAVSTFPDPYAADMFWIAPYIRDADLTEQDITPILKLIK